MRDTQGLCVHVSCLSRTIIMIMMMLETTSEERQEREEGAQQPRQKEERFKEGRYHHCQVRAVGEV